MKSKPKKGGGGGGGGGEAKSSTVMIILYRVFVLLQLLWPWNLHGFLKLKFEKILKLNYSRFTRNFRPQNVLFYCIYMLID